jgi:hypothetical protein
MYKKLGLGLVVIIVLAGAWLAFNYNRETPTETPTDWLTFTDEAGVYTFLYPATLSTTYLHPLDWPPQVDLLEGNTLVCDIPERATAHAGQIEKKEIGGREYCVAAQVEGAAGSTYTDYAYTTLLNNRPVRFIFTIQEPQCANYDEPKRSACEAEQGAFNLDQLVDQIAQSLVFTQ